MNEVVCCLRVVNKIPAALRCIKYSIPNSVRLSTASGMSDNVICSVRSPICMTVVVVKKNDVFTVPSANLMSVIP